MVLRKVLWNFIVEFALNMSHFKSHEATVRSSTQKMPAPAGAAEKAIILAKLERSLKGLPLHARHEPTTAEPWVSRDHPDGEQAKTKYFACLLRSLLEWKNHAYCDHFTGLFFFAWSEDLLLDGLQFSSQASNSTPNSYRWGPSVFGIKDVGTSVKLHGFEPKSNFMSVSFSFCFTSLIDKVLRSLPFKSC